MDIAADRYDVGIVGAGPAGLSAALILGRCRRTVVVFDHGRPRNGRATAVHGYLGHDGISPHDFRSLGRREVAEYGVVFVDEEITAVCCREAAGGEPTGFELTGVSGRLTRVQKLLLATGVADEIPSVPGIHEFYGTTVHHCPYCDGWEHRDRRLVALGTGESAVGLALLLRNWSADVTACTNGADCSAADLERLTRHGIGYRCERIVRTTGRAGILREIVFEDGPPHSCDALFFQAMQSQKSPLPAMAGCPIDDKAHVNTKHKQSTRVAGLYIAGDADGDVQFAIVAAAEGAIAATAIHRELQGE